jgi:hypothetical protein
MGAASSSTTDNTSIFNQQISQSCGSSASATALNDGLTYSGNTGCTINVSADADAYASCDMSSIASAVSLAAAEAGSDAESDLLPSISVSSANNTTDIQQYLESECTSSAMAEAINSNIKFLNNASSAGNSCVFNVSALATSESSCAISVAAAAFAEQDAVASSSSITTAMSAFFDGLTELVGSVVGAYTVIVIVIVIVIGLIVGGIIFFMNNNPDVVNNAVNKASSAAGPMAMLGGDIFGSSSSSLSLGAEYFNQATSAASSAFM